MPQELPGPTRPTQKGHPVIRDLIRNIRQFFSLHALHMSINEEDI